MKINDRHNSLRLQLHQMLNDINSWDEFTVSLKGIESAKLKGNLFELFVLAYLSVTRSSDFKDVFLFDDTPKELKDALHLGAYDFGTDLVAVSHDGYLFQVQAKCHFNSIPLSEIEPFLSDSINARGILIISTSRTLGSNALRKMFYDQGDFYRGRTELILNDKLSQLTKVQISSIRDYLILDYKSSKAWNIEHGVVDRSHYEDLARKKALPQNMTCDPESFFSEEWISWEHFLGEELKPTHPKKRDGSSVKKVYTFRLKNDLVKSLRKESEKRNCSNSALVEWILQDWLWNNRDGNSDK